jgi:hypothetical protein
MPTPNKPGSAKPSSAKPSSAKSGAPSSANPRAAKPAAKPSSAKPPAGGAKRPPAGPPKRKPSTSIVDRPQRPWGLIAVTAVIVVFAVAVIGYAVTRPGSDEPNLGEGRSVAPATASKDDIAKIEGITVKSFPGGNHTTGVVDYGEDSPPFGGEHNPIWAACTGTVYPDQIANENAVHMLEHGAIWITYSPELDQASKDALEQKVNGINFMAMSPYAGLRSPISLQAWGHQLFVDSVDDPRIEQFITALRLNPSTTPEYGATCSQPAFEPSESTPGSPFNG